MAASKPTSQRRRSGSPSCWFRSQFLPTWLLRQARDSFKTSFWLTAGANEDSYLLTIETSWTTATGLPPPQPPSSTKQKTWDEPGIQADKAAVWNCATGDLDRARLTAVSAQHSGDWLHARPISSCGLRLDDEAIRVAVGLRLGTDLCHPHSCPCGAAVDAKGLHGLSCKLATGRMPRHQALNDLVWRALSKAGIPSTKEAIRIVTHWWKTTRWSHADSVAKRQTTCLGRYRSAYVGWLVCWFHWALAGQCCWNGCRVGKLPNIHRYLTPLHSNQSHLRRWGQLIKPVWNCLAELGHRLEIMSRDTCDRATVSFSTLVDHGAALQRGRIQRLIRWRTWHLAASAGICFLILVFSPRESRYPGHLKKIIIIIIQ